MSDTEKIAKIKAMAEAVRLEFTEYCKSIKHAKIKVVPMRQMDSARSALLALDILPVLMSVSYRSARGTLYDGISVPCYNSQFGRITKEEISSRVWSYIGKSHDDVELAKDLADELMPEIGRIGGTSFLIKKDEKYPEEVLIHAIKHHVARDIEDLNVHTASFGTWSGEKKGNAPMVLRNPLYGHLNYFAKRIAYAKVGNERKIVVLTGSKDSYIKVEGMFAVYARMYKGTREDFERIFKPLLDVYLPDDIEPD